MQHVLQAEEVVRMWIGLKWRAPSGENDSSHPNDFRPASSDIRDIRPEGDVVVTEPTSILGGTGLVRWMHSALRRTEYLLGVGGAGPDPGGT